MKQSFSIFVINLPTDVVRRGAIEKRLQTLGAQFEIVDGIYGDDTRMVERYNETRAIREHGKPLRFGEKGCALAHALIYERMITEKIPHALILEDDILVPDTFLDTVETEVLKENKHWDWLSFDYRYVGLEYLSVWFSATLTTIKKKPSFIFYASIKVPYITLVCLFEEVRDRVARKFPHFAGAQRFYRPLANTGAYVVSLDGAKKLLPFTIPLRMSADVMPNKARFKTNFNLYGHVPLIVHQDSTYESLTLLSEAKWERLKK